MAPVGIRREVQLLVEGKDERNFQRIEPGRAAVPISLVALVALWRWWRAPGDNTK